jgi:hypothetical protein
MKMAEMDGKKFTQDTYRQMLANNILIACYNGGNPDPEVAGGTFIRDPATGRLRISTSLHLIYNEDLTQKLLPGSKCFIRTQTPEGQFLEGEIDLTSVKGTVQPCAVDPMTGKAISTKEHMCNLLNYPDKMDVGLSPAVESTFKDAKVFELASNPPHVGQTVMIVAPWTAPSNFLEGHVPNEVAAALPSAQIASIDMMGVPGALIDDKSFTSLLARVERSQSGSPVYTLENNQWKLLGHVEGKGKQQDFTQFAPANYPTQNIPAFKPN